jgi:hypothetical protein
MWELMNPQTVGLVWIVAGLWGGAGICATILVCNVRTKNRE